MLVHQLKERSDFIEFRSFLHFECIPVPADESRYLQLREMQVIEFYLKSLYRFLSFMNVLWYGHVISLWVVVE